MGIVSYAKRSAGLVLRPFRSEPLVLACPPNHELGKNPNVDASKLQDVEFVCFESDLPIRKATDRFLARHKVSVRIVAQYDNIETIKQAVEVGMGLAILPLPSVQQEAARGALQTAWLNDPELIRPVYIILRKGKKISRATRTFMDFILQSK
jgi:DNA-binding transcriptional LysR family regulator